jgi:ABC-type transport system involved in multi-copper enzyme maturation permease subunit
MAEKAHTEEARAVARGFYFIFPNLERFNLRDLVSYGREFPAEMLPNGVTYSLAYVVVVLCIAQFIFSRRDLP